MKISIIVPAYNVEQYIFECLNSVAFQTFNGVIECLVIDDCGQDKSINVAENFIDMYEGKVEFRIIHREKNGGLSAARNTGLKEACGDYIYFLDADDYITPDCIEKLVNTVERYPQAEMIQAGIVDQNENCIFDAKDWHNDTFIENGRYLQENLLFPSRWPISSWNKLIKREFLTNNNIFFLEGVIHEDVDFIYKIVNFLKFYAICTANTYIYRTNRKGSIINSTSIENSCISRLQIYSSCLELNDIDKDILCRSLFLRFLLAKCDTVKYNQLQEKLDSFGKLVLRKANYLDWFIMLIHFYLVKIFNDKQFIFHSFLKIVS